MVVVVVVVFLYTLFTRYSRLWNRLYNRFDNLLYNQFDNSVWQLVVSCKRGIKKHNNNNNHLWPFVRDYLGEPVPEETLTHPPSWSSSNLYQLLPSTMIHSILPVQITCLAIFCTTFLNVLFGLPLGLEPSTSYSIHFFIQSVSSFHCTCPYHRKLFCCSINIISSIPSLSLNSLPGTLSFILTLHIHLTIPT